MQKPIIMKESCPKNVVLMKTKKHDVWRLMTGFVQIGYIYSLLKLWTP